MNAPPKSGEKWDALVRAVNAARYSRDGKMTESLKWPMAQRDLEAIAVMALAVVTESENDKALPLAGQS